MLLAMISLNSYLIRGFMLLAMISLNSYPIRGLNSYLTRGS